MNQRLKELRKALGLTQRDFAKRANIGQSTVAMFETGDRELKDIHVNRICSEFNVNEAWLRTGEGNMFIELPENNIVAAATQLLGKRDPTFEAIVQMYAEMSPQDRESMMKFGMFLREKYGTYKNNE